MWQTLSMQMSESREFAGFWVRAMADAVDSLLLDVLTLFLIFDLIGAQYAWKLAHAEKDLEFGFLIFEAINSSFLQGLLVLTRGILTLLYFTYATTGGRFTVGKKLFGVSVVDSVTFGPLSSAQALKRCLSYALSWAPFGAGFAMAALHPEKKGLHDLLAGTVSLRVRESSQSNSE